MLIVWHKGINEFTMLCGGFIGVELMQLGYVLHGRMNTMGLNIINLCSNPVVISRGNMHHRLLLQYTSFTLSYVHASNGIDQMLFCCTAVLEYICIICQCGAPANAFETCRFA
jgi:hypothetical protein